MPNRSQRGIHLTQSPIRSLVSYSRQASKEGKEIFHLNIGQPDIPTPQAALEKIRNDNNQVIKYGPSEGLPELRARVSEYYDKYHAELGAEDVLVTTGASEAILFTLFAACNEGDEILIPEPFYANYIGFAQVCSVKIVPITTTLENEFALPDPAVFQSAITSKTKAIFLCNPGNPTGQLYEKSELEALGEIVAKNDLFLIVDEVYREFCYDQTFTSVLSLPDLSQHVIVIDSISKLFSSCGARVGFMISKNKALRQAVIKYAQLRLCPPYFGQELAIACYEDCQSYIEKAKEEYMLRREILYNGLINIKGIETYKPNAAFYNIIKLPVSDSMEFCKWLLTDFDLNGQTVMMAPAIGFYSNEELGRQQVRIAYVLKEEDLKSSLAILENALDVYPNQ